MTIDKNCKVVYNMHKERSRRMINLVDYKRDTHNKDYFRAVRNDNSTTKRVGTYAVSSVIVGGIAGAIFLIPAIGPLVATPTLMTALAYSGNLVFAGVVGGIGYGIHKSILHKDNVLSKAEKSIQTAGKIEKKFADYKNQGEYLSDRKYAKMIKKRDKKLMYFDSVHDMYHRKVARLASKLGYKLSDNYIKDRSTNPFVVETDTTKLKQKSKLEWLEGRRTKKLIKNFEKLDDLHEDYLDYLGIKGNDISVLEEFSANLDERRVINRTKRGVSTLKNRIFSSQPKSKIKNLFNKKNIINDLATDDANFVSALTGDKTSAPAYVAVDDMPLFEQLVMSAQIVASNRERLNLIKHEEDYVECVQPRVALSTLTSKQGYMKSLQKESISLAPFPILDKVSCEDACEYYNGSKFEDKMKGIKSAIESMQASSKELGEYIDTQNLDTNTTHFLVQLDFDNPKFTITKEFDNVQKALAYTQLAESTAREQRSIDNCEAYRVTTWSKEANKPYQISLSLSSFVYDDKSMEQSKEKMYNAYLSETENLHRSLKLNEDRELKDSTTMIIKTINSKTGMPTAEKEIVNSFAKLPTFGLNTFIADELGGAEPFSERDKKFRKEQFCRNSELTKDN